MYRHATDFYMLILYPTLYQNSWLVPKVFLVAFLRFITIKSHWQILTVFLLSDMNALNFFFLPNRPRLSSIMLTRNSKGRRLVLFLILEEMLSAFHYWEWGLLCVCDIWILLCWGGNVNWCRCYGEQHESSLKTNNKALIWPRYHSPGHISRENPNIHCSTIYNSQYMEAT